AHGRRVELVRRVAQRRGLPALHRTWSQLGIPKPLLERRQGLRPGSYLDATHRWAIHLSFDALDLGAGPEDGPLVRLRASRRLVARAEGGPSELVARRRQAL